MRSSLVIALVVAIPAVAFARNVEPGTISASGSVGPAFKLGSRLGGSGGYLMLDLAGDYAHNKSLGVVADLGLGLAGTIPLRLRVGGRYRIADLDLPVSPYGQVQFSYGRLFDVIGANLNVLGARFGVGGDYFLTAKLGVGVLLAVDLGSTLGQRPAFYGAFDALVYASYAVFGEPAQPVTDSSPPPAPASGL